MRAENEIQPKELKKYVVEFFSVVMLSFMYPKQKYIIKRRTIYFHVIFFNHSNITTVQIHNSRLKWHEIKSMLKINHSLTASLYYTYNKL